MQMILQYNHKTNQYECDARALRTNKNRPRIIPPKHFKWIIQSENAWCYLRNTVNGKTYLYIYVQNQHCASEIIFDGTAKDPIPFKNL